MIAKTTADLFRERGWGPGTKVLLGGDPDGPFEVRAVCNRLVVLGCQKGREHAFECTTSGGSLCTPTPPIPTREEWAELWVKLKAMSDRVAKLNEGYRHGLIAEVAVALDAIDAIAAKVEP
jgi:hypothetical protein